MWRDSNAPDVQWGEPEWCVGGGDYQHQVREKVRRRWNDQGHGINVGDGDPHGSKAPTVNINMSGGASVTLPGYPSITASSSGAMNAALGNNSGGNLSVGTDGFTYTDSIPPATIGGSSVNGSISASAFFTDDSPSPSGGGFDWIPVVGAVVTTAGEWYLCVQSDGLICELPPT